MQIKYMQLFKEMNNVDKIFLKQEHQSWCGLACLSIVCRYYGGNISQEKLVKISGTNVQGTSMLGLYQAAGTIGLKAEGLNGNAEELAKLSNPAILHFLLETGLEHYVVYLGMNGSNYIIADPGDCIKEMDIASLSKLWSSGALLSLKKGERFKEVKDVNKDKYNWLESLLSPDIKVLTIVLLFSILVSVLGMTLAIFSQKLVDDILPSKDYYRLLVGVLVLTLLLFFKNVFSYIRTKLSAGQIRDFSNRIINTFYSVVLYLPKSFFDSLKVGEVIARLNDASRIQKTISYICGVFLIDIITVLVIVAFLFFYWWPIALITVFGSLIFSIVFFKNANKILLGQKEVMINYAHSESYFFDSIQGVDVIKSYGKESVFSNSGKEVYSIFQNSIFNLTILSNKLGFLAQSIAIVIIISVIGLGSYGVISNHISLGELMAIMTFSSAVLGSVSSLMNAYFTYQEAKVAYDRLYEFVSIEEEAIEEEEFDMPINIDILEASELSFRYPGRPLILTNLNFSAKKGEITALIGEIGCGKTTLLNIFLRMYNSEKGEVTINNDSICRFNLTKWRSSIGLMPQEIKLFNSSLIENVCLEISEDNLKSAIALFERLGVLNYFNVLPLSYMTRIGEDGVNLSGGQRQLVGLCRALFSNPKILLLDEPTNNMDKNSAQLLWDIIQKERMERICIIVTHDELLASRCNISYKI